MSHPMVRLLFLLVLLVVVAEGVPRAKKVRCKDKKFPNCYKQDHFCPNACLRTCVVDCVSCQPVCIAPPPPPPSPPPPPPKQKKLRSPPPPRRMPPPPRTPPTHPPPPPPTSAPPLPPLPPLNPPPETETSPAKAYCRNRDYPHCYRMEQSCPSGCPNQCEVDCVTCSPVCDCNRPGAICQDPRFTGGDGISFYFHGKKDHNFCIVSDSNLHINAHFIGKTNQNMKRDFTWVQSLGILFDSHKLVISAKKTAIWNNAHDHLDLTFNDEPLVISPIEGGKWNSNKTPYLTITRPSEVNSVVIEVEGNFKIKAKVVPITEKESRVHNYGITQENCFAHLDLGFKFYSLTGNVSGVLGQTYGSNYLSRVKMGVDMPVLGGDKEFMSSTLLSTDCAAARFSGRLDSVINSEYGDLNCGSGIHGGGVICKR